MHLHRDCLVAAARPPCETWNTAHASAHRLTRQKHVRAFGTQIQPAASQASPTHARVPGWRTGAKQGVFNSCSSQQSSPPALSRVQQPGKHMPLCFQGLSCDSPALPGASQRTSCWLAAPAAAPGGLHAPPFPPALPPSAAGCEAPVSCTQPALQSRGLKLECTGRGRCAMGPTVAAAAQQPAPSGCSSTKQGTVSTLYASICMGRTWVCMLC